MVGNNLFGVARDEGLASPNLIGLTLTPNLTLTLTLTLYLTLTLTLILTLTLTRTLTRAGIT